MIAYTPSKELLSEVLVVSVLSVDTHKDRPNYIYYDFGFKGNTFRINIYELAIKTKQKYPDLNLNLAATDISEFWRQANELVCRTPQRLYKSPNRQRANLER